MPNRFEDLAHAEGPEGIQSLGLLRETSQTFVDLRPLFSCPREHEEQVLMYMDKVMAVIAMSELRTPIVLPHGVDELLPRILT